MRNILVLEFGAPYIKRLTEIYQNWQITSSHMNELGCEATYYDDMKEFEANPQDAVCLFVCLFVSFLP